MFKRILTVLFFVDDIKSSSDWYKVFLRQEPIEQTSEFASFDVGGTFLNFHRADARSPVSTGGTVSYWLVDDLNKTIETAISLGGQIYRGPLNVPEIRGTICQIKDPFGNIFGLESRD